MSRRIRLALVLSTCGALAAPAFAQELFIYPDKGQSQQQQEKDKYECYSWAKSQSGFDPMAPPTTRSAPPTRTGGSVAGGALGGAAAGAALGAVGGAIAGNAGKGAAIGAGTGGLLGGLVRASEHSKDEQARKRWEQNEANAYGQARSNYNRAYSACLSGRGYTVR